MEPFLHDTAARNGSDKGPASLWRVGTYGHPSCVITCAASRVSPAPGTYGHPCSMNLRREESWQCDAHQRRSGTGCGIVRHTEEEEEESGVLTVSEVLLSLTREEEREGSKEKKGKKGPQRTSPAHRRHHRAARPPGVESPGFYYRTG